MSKSSSTKYYQDNEETDYKKWLVKDTKVFLKKKNKKKGQYCTEQYKSLLEDETQKLIEYKKKRRK